MKFSAAALAALLFSAFSVSAGGETSAVAIPDGGGTFAGGQVVVEASAGERTDSAILAGEQTSEAAVTKESRRVESVPAGEETAIKRTAIAAPAGERTSSGERTSAAGPQKLLSLENGVAVLSDGRLSLALGGTTAFHLRHIRYKDREWAGDNPLNRDIWKLKLVGPDGVNPEVLPQHGEYQGVQVELNTADTAAVCFTWRMKAGIRKFYSVRMYVGIGRRSGLTEWRIEAGLPKGWRVTETEFPRLVVGRTEACRAILPTGWGTEQPLYPAADYACVYPSHSAGMQLLLLRDGKETVYFATHDGTASLKTLRLRAFHQAARLSVEAAASTAWTPQGGGVFRLPWRVSVGFSDRGWETCATQWYKPFTYRTVWGSRTLPERKIPEWLLDNDLWLRPHFAADSTWRNLEAALDFFGPRCGLHWYRWHQIAYDSEYPEYFPPKPAIPDFFRKARKMGAHVIPYINGRLWDPASDSYRKWHGRAASCRKADGTLYTEIYPTSKIPNTITCPASPIWQRVLTGLVRRFRDELPTDGVYIDQIGAAAGVPCYAENHPHPAGGGEFWHAAYRRLLTDIRKDLKQGSILITEENAECFMDLFDILLMVNTPQSGSVRIVPLFPLVYSDRAMTDGFLYYRGDEPVHDPRFRWKTAMCLLWGSQLGWIQPELIMAPEALPEARFLRTLADFRHGQHEVFHGGSFLGEVRPEGDNPVISRPGLPNFPAVLGALWRSPAGREVLYIVNIDDRPHTVSVGERDLTAAAGTALRGERTVTAPAAAALRLDL